MSTQAHLSLTILLLSATLAASVWSEHRTPAALAGPLESIGRDIAGWTATRDQQLTEAFVTSLAPTAYLSRDYRKGGSQLGLFVAFYAQQRAGESMHSPKHCLPGAGWEISDSRSVRLVVRGNETSINRNVVQRNGQRMLVLYWYQSPTRVFASEYEGKFLLVWDRMVKGYPGGSIVRLTLRDRPEDEQGAMNFAGELIPQLTQCLSGR